MTALENFRMHLFIDANDSNRPNPSVISLKNENHKHLVANCFMWFHVIAAD